MCGIAGWFDLETNLENNKDRISKMSETLSRRGPDASGEYIRGNIALIHRRLIVIDPAGGEQPMSAEYRGKEYVLVYNGELYNTEELRTELAAAGHVFKGHSDTEVLLKCYIEWKEACLEKLNGIFAFAVWDASERRLFAARDRAGVKPFFYYRYNGGMIFASEIKTLMESGVIKPVIDKYGLYQTLLLGPGRSCGCGLIKGVEELFPGEYLTFDGSRLDKRAYWRLKAQEHIGDLNETIEKTRFLITDAIERQLVSDVPLACFLSGGLDSSIITMVAAKKYAAEGRTLHTYSVDYEDNDKYFVENAFQPTADAEYIKLMRDFTSSAHHVVCLDNIEVASALDAAADARDIAGMADIDSSLLLFCEEIKKKFTVCVSGECADELFGGYPWYHNPDVLFKRSFPWANSLPLRKKLFASVVGDDAEDFVKSEYENTIALADCLPDESALERRMREMFALNFYGFMQTLLERKDRMSMYTGLEVRVPFCDHRLVEYAYNMPWEFKSLHNREKGIVREAFRNLLPYEIVQRKKSPYPKTFNPTFMEAVATKVKRLSEDKSSIISAICDKNVLSQMRENPEMCTVPWYGQLMRVPEILGFLIQLDRVFRKFGLEIEE